MSYGIYLWHLFVVEWLVMQDGLRAGTALASVIAITVAIAALSWRYFEKPLMALGRRDRSKTVSRELSSMGAP